MDIRQLRNHSRGEIAAAIIAHLLQQGMPASVNGACLYRDKLGRSCAVGCLIPDEIYTPNMEVGGVPSLIGIYGAELGIADLDPGRVALLMVAQRVHDAHAALPRAIPITVESLRMTISRHSSCAADTLERQAFSLLDANLPGEG